MLCPECGKVHRNQRTAQKCYQDAKYPLNHAIIADVCGNVKVELHIRERSETMNNFYDSLPLPKRFIKGD